MDNMELDTIVSGEINTEEKTMVEESPRLPTSIPITELRRVLPEKGTKVWCPVTVGNVARWVPVTKSHLRKVLKGFLRGTRVPGTMITNPHDGEVHVYLANWE